MGQNPLATNELIYLGNFVSPYPSWPYVTFHVENENLLCHRACSYRNKTKEKREKLLGGCARTATAGMPERIAGGCDLRSASQISMPRRYVTACAFIIKGHRSNAMQATATGLPHPKILCGCPSHLALDRPICPLHESIHNSRYMRPGPGPRLWCRLTVDSLAKPDGCSDLVAKLELCLAACL